MLSGLQSKLTHVEARGARSLASNHISLNVAQLLRERQLADMARVLSVRGPPDTEKVPAVRSSDQKSVSRDVIYLPSARCTFDDALSHSERTQRTTLLIGKSHREFHLLILCSFEARSQLFEKAQMDKQMPRGGAKA